jgi:hypothetical protein
MPDDIVVKPFSATKKADPSFGGQAKIPVLTNFQKWGNSKAISGDFSKSVDNTNRIACRSHVFGGLPTRESVCQLLDRAVPLGTGPTGPVPS